MAYGFWNGHSKSYYKCNVQFIFDIAREAYLRVGVYFFFNVARIANEPLVIIQELIRAATWRYERQEHDLGSQRRAWTATWYKPRRDDYCRARHRRLHLTTTWLSAQLLRRDVSRLRNAIRSRLAASFIATGWRTSISPSKTKRHRRLNKWERSGEDTRESEADERAAGCERSEGKGNAVGVAALFETQVLSSCSIFN